MPKQAEADATELLQAASHLQARRPSSPPLPPPPPPLPPPPPPPRPHPHQGDLVARADKLADKLAKAAEEGRLKLRREEKEALASRRKELKQTLAVLERVRSEREAEAGKHATSVALRKEAQSGASPDEPIAQNGLGK